MFEVKLKPGHPTGLYHRAGIEFSAGGPTFLEEVSEDLVRDRWLIVGMASPDAKIGPPQPAENEVEALKQNAQALIEELEHRQELVQDLRQTNSDLSAKVTDAENDLRSVRQELETKIAGLEEQLSDRGRIIEEKDRQIEEAIQKKGKK